MHLIPQKCMFHLCFLDFFSSKLLYPIFYLSGTTEYQWQQCFRAGDRLPSGAALSSVPRPRARDLTSNCPQPALQPDPKLPDTVHYTTLIPQHQTEPAERM